MSVNELEQMKARTRAVWAAGDYPAIARRQLWPVGERIVARAGVIPGERVLDVACGTGNAAIRAALAGARVVGVDLTPELLGAAEQNAVDAGVEVSWLEGDAEALPVDDVSFDAVLSVFGCMFAPRHETAARELARALRPGGRLVVCAWTPDGSMGEFFRTLGSYLPPPPPFAQPPLLWGAEEHVRSIFEGSGVELEFDRELIELPRLASIEDEVEFATSKFGPLIMARGVLEPQGRWDELLDDLRRLIGTQKPAEYLVVSGRKVGTTRHRPAG